MAQRWFGFPASIICAGFALGLNATTLAAAPVTSKCLAVAENLSEFVS